MPFYEYECDNCKFYTELLQKISDPPLRKCPSCGKSTMKKLVSAPVFRLKGGGWYETDFKSDKEGKRNLAVDKEPESSPEPKPAAATSESGDSKTSETKATESKPAEPKAATESKSESAGSRGRTRPAAAAKSKSVSRAQSKARPKASARSAPKRRKGR